MTDRRTLYVQNIPPQTTRDDLYSAFNIFGDISNVTLFEKNDHALIEFQEEGDATAALNNMDLSEIYGQTILVNYATKDNMVDKRKAIWEDQPEMGKPDMLAK